MRNINQNSRKTICVILLACSVLLNGCRQRSQPSEKTPEKSVEKIPKKKACQMVQIEKFTLIAEESLTLDYHVANPFKYDIWVCEDINSHSKKADVETRIDIDSETVLIKLRFNLESNILINPMVEGKYRRLPPGESYSGRIILDLPIRNASPVYEFGERRKKHKQIVLHRIILEVGYFEGEYINSIIETIEEIKRGKYLDEELQEKLQNAKIEPRIVEEIQEGQSHKFLYCTYTWPGHKEKSAKAVFSARYIPCSVVVDDK